MVIYKPSLDATEAHMRSIAQIVKHFDERKGTKLRREKADERKGTQLKRGTMSCVPFYLPKIRFAKIYFAVLLHAKREFLQSRAGCIKLSA